MKKINIKKAISIILCLLLIVYIFPIGTFAIDSESGSCSADGDTVFWEMTSDGTLTIRGKGKMIDYPYPGAVPWDYDHVKMLVIESGVTHVSSYICYGDNYLQSVSLPDTITSIGENSFWGCTNLNDFVLPKNITSIGNRAFHSCDRLTSISFPKTVQYIGEGVLGYCNSLQKIYVDSGNLHYTSSDGVLYTKDKKTLIAFPAKKDAVSYTIPAGVTRIGEAAFADCDKLEIIDVPATVSSIGNNAFSYCYSLNEMVIPVGVKKIEDSTFWDCTSLQTVVIPEGVISIEEMAFGSCINLENFTIPSTLEKIGRRAFDGCNSIKSFQVAPGNGYFSTEAGVLYNADKTHLIWYPAGNTRTSFSVPDTVTNIEQTAFENSKYLKVVVIPDSVKYIADNAFMDCTGLTSVTIPASVTSLGSVSFCGCENLVVADIQADITSIPYIAFDGCTNLQTVFIPRSVKTIGTGAFDDCDNLTDIYFEGSEEDWAQIEISGYNEILSSNSVTIHYNSEKLEYDNGLCKYCGQLHDEYIFGTMINFLHKILYFVCQYLSQTAYIVPDGSEEDIVYFSEPNEKNIITDSISGISYVNNEILLSVKEGTNADTVNSLVSELDGIIVGWIAGFDEYQIRLNKSYSEADLQTLTANIKNRNYVLDVSLNFAMHLDNDDYLVPDDPWGRNQDWNSDIPDGNNWGVEAIKAPVAWAHRDEMNPITIGLIDNGFVRNHSDLTIFCPQFADNVPVDDHGVHVAGTMAADMDNDGITGVMPTAKSNGERIVSLIGVTENFSENVTTVAEVFETWFTFEFKCCIAELLVRNTKVINVSQGLKWSSEDNGIPYWDSSYFSNGQITDKARNLARSYSVPVESFLRKCLDKNYEFVIVSAAGNDSGTDAAFSSPWNAIEDETVKSHIIVVGSITNGGRDNRWFKADTHKGYSISDFSDLGNRVDVVAPGKDIYSTVPVSMDTDGNADGFAYMSGTSMAAPHVSGVASMVWSINPNLTGSQVKEIVVKSADRPITHTDGITYNILNAENAVNKAIESKTSISPWTPLDSNYGAVVSRVVESANNNNIISNAIISAYDGNGEYVGSAMSDENAGQFELYLPDGEYTIVAYQMGYMPAVKRNIKATSGEVNYIDWFKLSAETVGSQYTVQGKITNAVDNSPISNVKMRFINLYEQEFETEIYTNNDGTYRVTLPTACYEVSLSKDGFVNSEFNVVAAADMVRINQNSMLSPSLGNGQFRMVLTWNENPRDLDSHITGQKSNGSSFHVYYSHQNEYDGDTLVANLDVDDTTSYGPETITLNPTTTGTYKYYIYRYSGSGSISTSGAQIKLYKGNTLIGTYNAPTNQGTGDYWTVFEITNGTVKNINKIASSVQ